MYTSDYEVVIKKNFFEDKTKDKTSKKQRQKTKRALYNGENKTTLHCLCIRPPSFSVYSEPRRQQYHELTVNYGVGTQSHLVKGRNGRFSVEGVIGRKSVVERREKKLQKVEN